MVSFSFFKQICKIWQPESHQVEENRNVTGLELKDQTVCVAFGKEILYFGRRKPLIIKHKNQRLLFGSTWNFLNIYIICSFAQNASRTSRGKRDLAQKIQCITCWSPVWIQTSGRGTICFHFCFEILLPLEKL